MTDTQRRIVENTQQGALGRALKNANERGEDVEVHLFRCNNNVHDDDGTERKCNTMREGFFTHTAKCSACGQLSPMYGPLWELASGEEKPITDHKHWYKCQENPGNIIRGMNGQQITCKCRLLKTNNQYLAESGHLSRVENPVHPSNEDWSDEVSFPIFSQK